MLEYQPPGVVYILSNLQSVDSHVLECLKLYTDRWEVCMYTHIPDISDDEL